MRFFTRIKIVVIHSSIRLFISRPSFVRHMMIQSPPEANLNVKKIWRSVLDFSSTLPRRRRRRRRHHHRPSFMSQSAAVLPPIIMVALPIIPMMTMTRAVAVRSAWLCPLRLHHPPPPQQYQAEATTPILETTTTVITTATLHHPLLLVLPQKQQQQHHHQMYYVV